MSVFSTIGTKISIGTTAKFSTSTAYAGDTWTAIGEAAEFGEFGDTAEEITFNSITDGRVRKLKGVRDAGTFELTVGRDPTDAGQIALRAANASPNGYNFKIELTDKPLTGASPKNTVFYFNALVNGAANVLDDVTQQKFSLLIGSEIFEVVASAT